MYSHEVYVDQISKRDQIRTSYKETGDYIEGSGHWDDNGGVYLSVEKRGTKTVRKRDDVVLDPADWSIFVMIPYKAKVNNVTSRT